MAKITISFKVDVDVPATAPADIARRVRAAARSFMRGLDKTYVGLSYYQSGNGVAPGTQVDLLTGKEKDGK